MWVVRLLAANLVVVTIVALALIFGFLPKIERAVQTTERVEAQFQSFANEVQPVVATGAEKTIETIRKMNSDRMSETATEGTNKVLDAAAERTKRFLDRDKTK